MRQDTDKKKEAMTRMEMRISKEDKALIYALTILD